MNGKSRKRTQLLELCKLKFEFCYPLLTSINFFNRIIHLLEFNVLFGKNQSNIPFLWKLLLYELKDVVVVFQSNIRRNTENFGGKYFFNVFAIVSFSPLIRPFSRCPGLLRTVCWLNVVGNVPCANLLIRESVFTICLASKRSEHTCKFLVDVNSLSARRQKALYFFLSLSSPGNSKKLRSGLFLRVIFAHRDGTNLTVTPILLSK